MALIFDVNQYKYKKKGPLDAKALVKKYSDLLNPYTWTLDGSIAAYNGMVTAVWLNTADTSKNGVYFLYDPNVTSALKVPDVTNEANWHKLSKADDLNDISSKIAALSAEAARLSSALDEKASIDSVFTKEETADAIANAIKGIPAVDLTEYAKTADVNTLFNTLSSEIAKKSDIENVYSKAESDAMLLAAIGSLPEGSTVVSLIDQTKTDILSSVTGLASRVSANEEAIAILNGEGDGSVQKIVNDAIAAIAIASTAVPGIVKASEEISVADDGTMNIEHVSTDKLTQGVDLLVLEGGDSQSPLN